VELRRLRYFVAVAEMENVSRAALKLHVSQPALSRQIRDLEDEIGFSLLERTAKSVRLTDAGRVPRQCARVVAKRGRSRHESARRCKRRAHRAPCRLLTDANRRDSAENLAGISAGDAKRLRFDFSVLRRDRARASYSVAKIGWSPV